MSWIIWVAILIVAIFITIAEKRICKIANKLDLVEKELNLIKSTNEYNFKNIKSDQINSNNLQNEGIEVKDIACMNQCCPVN